MLEFHAILHRQRCYENMIEKTGTLSDAYFEFTVNEKSITVYLVTVGNEIVVFLVITECCILSELNANVPVFETVCSTKV